MYITIWRCQSKDTESKIKLIKFCISKFSLTTYRYLYICYRLKPNKLKYAIRIALACLLTEIQTLKIWLFFNLFQVSVSPLIRVLKRFWLLIRGSSYRIRSKLCFLKFFSRSFGKKNFSTLTHIFSHKVCKKFFSYFLKENMCQSRKIFFSEWATKKF